MKITYKLTLDDFLEYQLYSNSKSKLSNNRRRNSKIGIPILYLLIGLFYIYRGSDIFGLLLIFAGLLWFGFYPKFSKNRTKKYFTKHIIENYAEKVDIENELDFQDEYIQMKSKKGESKILTTELKGLIELEQYYFIKLSSIESLIVPKNVIQDETAFKEKLNKYNIEYMDEKIWKWD